MFLTVVAVHFIDHTAAVRLTAKPHRSLCFDTAVRQPIASFPLSAGTWSWGNQLLWGYDESMDPELQELFDLMVKSGVNLFDTAVSTSMNNAKPDDPVQ